MVTRNESFGRIGEKLVEIELLKRGIDFWEMGRNNPSFDLIVDTKKGLKKVQIKTANKNKKGKFGFYLMNCVGAYDYLILVGISDNGKLDFYIIPADKIRMQKAITMGEETMKYHEFKDNWDLLY